MKNLLCYLILGILFGYCEIAVGQDCVCKAVDADKHIGEECVVTGVVRKVTHWANGNITFINLDGVYSNHKMNAVFFHKDNRTDPATNNLAIFEASFGDLANYFEDKEVVVKGKIDIHDYKPQIILNSPDDISLKE